MRKIILASTAKSLLGAVSRMRQTYARYGAAIVPPRRRGPDPEIAPYLAHSLALISATYLHFQLIDIAYYLCISS